MLKSMRVRLSFVAAAVAASLCIAAARAAAQQEQTGLVVVNIEGNTIQVPIAIAANICDVNVAVLVGRVADDAAQCDAAADAEATSVTPVDTGTGADQSGLVIVNIEDNVVQVPVAVAANICDVNVAVLVADLQDDAAECNADARAVARNRNQNE